MRCSIVVVAVTAALVAAVACSGDVEPSMELTIEADLTALPADADPAEAMDGVVDVIKRRLKAVGASGRVTVTEPNLLTVQIGGTNMTPDEAELLIGSVALLEFRTPVRDESGQVVCIAPDGSEFSVPVANATEGVDITTGGKEGECTSGGTSVVGLIKWEPAAALDSSNPPVERVLTGSFVEPGGAEAVVGTSSVCLPACVTLNFTSEGALLFQQITQDTVGYPLAIFLDEELISAPNVNQTITGGNAIISGVEVDEAKTLAIQINAGSIPVPIMTVSVTDL